MATAVNSNNTNKEICGICLGSLIENDLRILPCSHEFCFGCLNGLAIENVNIKCPTCRQDCELPQGQIKLLPMLTSKNEEILPLKIIDMSQMRINSEHLRNISDMLETDDHVIRINLKESEVNNEQCHQIGIFLKTCTNVEAINLEGNINMGNGFKTICVKLENSSKTLKEINFSKCFLSPEQLEHAKNLLKVCINIETLYLNCQESWKMLICDEQKNLAGNLKHIHLENASLNTNCESIGKFLENCCKIETINLKGNKCMETNFKSICQGLVSSSQNLRHIYLQQCLVGDFPCSEFGKLLETCTNIETINLSGNTIDLSIVLKSLIQSSNSLKHICFDLYQFNEKENEAVRSLFKSCSKLETVYIFCNGERNCGFFNIYDGLYFSTDTLKSLYFLNHDLRLEECRLLGNLFQSCSKLEVLSLQSNKNMGIGLNHLFKGLDQSSNTLKMINCANCDLNANECKQIGQLLESCPNIEIINLRGNMYMYNGLKYICNSLKTLKSLKNINFGNCNLGVGDCKVFEEFLESCSTLETINFSDNLNMKDLFQFIINGLVKSKTSLKHIYFNNCGLVQSNYNLLADYLKHAPKLETLELLGNSSYNYFEFCNQLLYCSKTLRNFSHGQLKNNYATDSVFEQFTFRVKRTMGSLRY